MNFKNFLEYPNKKILILITLMAFVSVIILTLIMAPTELYLKGKTGYGVIEFEFAWTAERINTIFKAWGSDGKQKELLMTYIDFFYIPSYVICLSGCTLLITRKLENKSQKIGLFIVLFPFIAGVFDVIENINLILMLTNDAFIQAGSPFVASVCASFKFLFLTITEIFILYGIVLIFIKKIWK